MINKYAEIYKRARLYKAAKGILRVKTAIDGSYFAPIDAYRGSGQLVPPPAAPTPRVVGLMGNSSPSMPANVPTPTPKVAPSVVGLMGNNSPSMPTNVPAPVASPQAIQQAMQPMSVDTLGNQATAATINPTVSTGGQPPVSTGRTGAPRSYWANDQKMFDLWNNRKNITSAQQRQLERYLAQHGMADMSAAEKMISSGGFGFNKIQDINAANKAYRQAVEAGTLGEFMKGNQGQQLDAFYRGKGWNGANEFFKYKGNKAALTRSLRNGKLGLGITAAALALPAMYGTYKFFGGGQQQPKWNGEYVSGAGGYGY